jgi:hypothetical protein
MLPLVALLLACSGQAPSGRDRPSAQEILQKPLHGNLKDAHFSVSDSTNSADFKLAGEGDIVVNPRAAYRVQLTTMTTSQWAGVTKTTETTISGPEGVFTRKADERKWKRTAGSGPVGRYAAWFAAANPELAGEEVINGSRCWHLLADYGSSDVELWIRQSDGFPMREKYGAAIYSYQRFNTGVKVSAPAASEVKPEPKQLSVHVGETAHLFAVDVTVVTANTDYHSASGFMSRAPSGQRFVALEVLYRATGQDTIQIVPEWRLDAAQPGQADIWGGGSNPLQGADLSKAGDQTRGFLYFSVPTGASGLKATTKVGDDTVIVDLGA